MTAPWVRSLDELRRGDIALAGGKGANLGELIAAGVPVPRGFVVTTAAYRSFVEANRIAGPLEQVVRSQPPDEAAATILALFTAGSWPADLRRRLVDAYAGWGDAAVAVRSSATAEDQPEASFAGQQDSYLHVRGDAALIEAVRNCWASLWTARAISYRASIGVDPASVALAVVVQEMVDADASGVLFTANPETGRRDEVVLAAAWGLGESVVGGTVDADQVVVSAGRVVARRTGDKRVQTVSAGDGTAEIAVPEPQRRRPVLDDEAANELAELGRRIETHFGAPQDIEWARSGDAFWVVQARPITVLPEPVGPVPSDWPVPDPRSLYFRASIVEQLPDPLSPLFAELAEATVPESLRRLVRELTGREVLRADDLGFPSIHGYAYYRYGRGAMRRMLQLTPVLLPKLYGSNRNGLVARWRDIARPRYVAAVEAQTGRDLAQSSAAELLAAMEELTEAGAEYYTGVQTIIPLAVTSELCFAGFYRVAVRRRGDPPPQIFLLGFDSAPIRADKSLYDLAGQARSDPALAGALRERPTGELVEAVRSGRPPGGVPEGAWESWRARFSEHLGRFGHAVYNLDFVHPVPADDPAPLLDAVRYHLQGEAGAEAGADPYERQAQSVARREQATASVSERLDPLRAVIFRRLLRWAQSCAPLREDALADVGLAWPQLRRLAAELGRRLRDAGLVGDPEDVYWLHRAEILDGLGGAAADPTSAWFGTVVEQRRERWRGARRATPPQMLPAGTWLDWLGAMMPARTQIGGSELKGIGASPGQVTGVARVLAGPRDFGAFRPGEILVASITTPAWTPLFSRAAGVVTDIGGPLSHSSIVAREYGIPAVLGTDVATRRIASGTRLRVDGDRGVVRLLD